MEKEDWKSCADWLNSCLLTQNKLRFEDLAAELK